MSTTPPIVTAAAAQREILRQALADAVYYCDPPLHCAACPTPDELCDQCASGHERARAYLALSHELGLKTPS